MSRATMVFADKDGQIDFSIVFDGGFKPDSPAHQHAQIVLKMLDEMMGAKTDEAIQPLVTDQPALVLL